MPKLHVVVEHAPAELRTGLERLHNELGIPAEFPPEVLRAAAAQVAAGPREADGLDDRTDIPFVTIDPPGARDLDQAVHLERRGDGYRVFYAIADLAAWIAPNGPIDNEAHARGQTFYAPIFRTPLHPQVISEDVASLLPGELRAAIVWQIDVDHAGVVEATSARRAWVRSRAQLSYDEVQAALDGDDPPELYALLKEVGQRREALEIERGGVSLNLPEQEVVADAEGWQLQYRTPLPVEGWNAQISLLTGAAAAQIMIDGGVGLLRTLPPARPRDVERLRRVAKSLDIEWPKAMSYPDFVRSIDVTSSRGKAMMNACTVLFRGAAYELVQPGGANPRHEALATHYAHATAPLRRLVDRYVETCCVCLTSGTSVPQWVTDKLPGLPQTMRESDQRAKKYERGIVDLVEALVLQHRVGETFPATVVDVSDDGKTSTVSVPDPAVETRVHHALPLGEQVQLRLTDVDLIMGRVTFEPVAAG